MSMSEPPKDEGLEKFEEQLRGFRPAAPKALAIPDRRAPRGLMAAAAAVLLVLGLVLAQPWSRRPNDQPPIGSTVETDAQHSILRPVTVGQLNAALRASDETLDRLLDEAGPNILPRGRRGTVLNELGKE